MIKQLLVIPIVLAAALPAASQQQPQKQPAATQTQQQASIPEPLPPLSVPAGYKYDASGRRDPFVNPIPKPLPEEAAAPPVVRPAGLKGLLMSDAKLMGVVTSKDLAMNKVIILAPGNKTYFASRGDTLWDAVIKDIQPDAVVFTTVVPQRPGQQASNTPPSRDVVRKVHPSTGENK
jgi:hypothetical protein